MTSLQLHLQARAAVEVPWDRSRERRVLDQALETRRRRALRRMAFELVAALAVTFMAGRVLSRAATENGEVRPAIAVPAPAIKGVPIGGVAGTGGHGGTGSAGYGGNAGTG